MKVYVERSLLYVKKGNVENIRLLDVGPGSITLLMFPGIHLHFACITFVSVNQCILSFVDWRKEQLPKMCYSGYMLSYAWLYRYVIVLYFVGLSVELQRYIDIDIESRYYRPFSNIDIDIDIAILAEKISTYFDILKTAKPDYFGHFDYFLAEFSKEKYRNF